MLVRFDRADGALALGATPIEVTPEGFRVYRGTAVFGDVVYDYPEDGRSEYVPAGEALSDAAVASILHKPFTIHHPDDLLSADDPESIKAHTEGTVRAARADLSASPPTMEVEVVVWTRPAQEAIESGEVVELSPGYRCQEDRAPAGAVGPGGKPYQWIQRGRQYNHLSGVMRARGVTPDGRRARLDEDRAAADPFADLAAYAHLDAAENIMPDPDIDLDAAPTADDAPPSTTPATDAPADPAAALAMFSPEAAEILKTLPPADMEVLQNLALGKAAEEAEEAVIEAGIAADPAIEVEDAPTPPPAAAAAMTDAPPPVATPAGPAPLTANDIPSIIEACVGAIKSLMSETKKADAATSRLPPCDHEGCGPTGCTRAARTDAAEGETFRSAVAKATGARLDSVDAAAAKAVAVVREHAGEAMGAMAERAAKDGRRDDLLAMFADADQRRRDGLMDEQFAAIHAVASAEDNYRQDAFGAPLGLGGDDLPAFGLPGGAALPTHIDFGRRSAGGAK